MKKLIAAFVIALCAAGAVFSQELKMSISGEVKTGIFWYAEDVAGQERTPNSDGAFVHNSDENDWFEILQSPDSYSNLKDYHQGRFRVNFNIEKGNIGAKFRFETTSWASGASTANWGYAFLYGNFFDEQFRVSAGKLGDSSWGTGDPYLEDKELDTTMGIRFEYMPLFAPGLNVGFVLNDWNTTAPSTAEFTDLLAETVLGLSYTHEYFHLRFAYRLDSEADTTKTIAYAEDQGGMLVYRLEERVIQRYLPGFQIWANGYFEELGHEQKNLLRGKNRLYAQYDPDNFTARLRLGYNIINTLQTDQPIDKSRQYFSVGADFYYKLFHNLLNVGLAFDFAKDFGADSVVSDSYLHWYIEPQIRLNLGNGIYLAFVYRYLDDFYKLDFSKFNREPPAYLYTDYECVNTKTHQVNLRAVFTF
jgi:hypothetical protein